MDEINKKYTQYKSEFNDALDELCTLMDRMGVDYFLMHSLAHVFAGSIGLPNIIETKHHREFCKFVVYEQICENYQERLKELKKITDKISTTYQKIKELIETPVEVEESEREKCVTTSQKQ